MATISMHPSLAFLDSRYVNVSGDTMTGGLSFGVASDIDMDGNNVLNASTVDSAGFTIGTDVDVQDGIEIRGDGVGIEDVPWIFINDDRAAGRSEYGEATILIDSDCTYAINVADGSVRMSNLTWFYPYATQITSGYSGAIIRGGFGSGLHIFPRNSTFDCSNVIIGYYSYYAQDHDHDLESPDPTLFMQAAESPNTDNTLWGAIRRYGNSGSNEQFSIAAPDKIHIVIASDSSNWQSDTVDAANGILTGISLTDGNPNPVLTALEGDIEFASNADFRANIYQGDGAYTWIHAPAVGFEGIVEHQADMFINDNCALTFGNGTPDAGIWWRTVGNDFLGIFTACNNAGYSGNIIIGNSASYTQNYDHAVSVNPTLIIHSAIAPNDNNTQWISFCHNQADGVIDVGAGGLSVPVLMKIGDGGTTNYTEIKADGEINLHGTARVTKRIGLMPTASMSGTIAPAELHCFGMPQLLYTSTQNERRYWSIFAPTDWETGTVINAEIWWSHDNTAQSGDVSWHLGFNDVNTGGSPQGGFGVFTGTSDTGTDADKCLVQTLHATLSAAASDSLWQFYLERNIAGATDNLAETAEVQGVMLVYTANKLGTAT